MATMTTATTTTTTASKAGYFLHYGAPTVVMAPQYVAPMARSIAQPTVRGRA